MSRSQSKLRSCLLATTVALLVGAPAAMAMQDHFPAPEMQSEGGHGGGGHGGSGSEGEGGKGEGGKGGGEDRGKGGKGGKGIEDAVLEGDGEEEDSDRPAWAGVPGRDGKPGKGNDQPGGKKGDLYGDLYVILRDANGVPILDENGNVQPILIDGTVVKLTPEGDLPPEYADLVQEVEFGRLNVGRAPWHVLDSRFEEVVTLLNDPNVTSVSLDAGGRLVVTMADGTTKTVDAPLENLALYVALMNTGTLEGVTISADKLGALAFMIDGQLTAEDMLAAASFLAASADKGETFSSDLVVYYNLILKITGETPIVSPDGASYYDFTAFTYDRAAIYEGKTVDVLVLQTDGTWKVQTVDIYAVIFGSTTYTSSGGLAGFVQAIADANKVINFLHEYAVPATEL